MSLAEAVTDQGCAKLLKTVRDTTDAPTDAVAASVFFRRLGFFLAAQFQSVSLYKKMFAGSLDQVGILYEDSTFKFTVPSEGFVETENSQKALRYILDTYGHPMVEYYSKQAKVPKLILWENVWGYVIWVYGQLIREDAGSADADLNLLLDDQLWKPAMRRSPFKQYMKNQTALEASTDYKRVTCCLLKEIPNTEKCPYCPNVK